MDVPTSKTLPNEPPAALSPALSSAPVGPPDPSPPSPAFLSSLSSSSSSRAVSEVLQLDDPQPEPETELRRSSRNRIASRWVRELQEGVGVSSSRRSDPRVPRGVTALRENWPGFEFALVAEKKSP